MIPQNLGFLLRDTVARVPAKKAFLCKEGGRYISLTWAEFAQRVNAVAWSLLDRGIEPGDRIAILSENRLEWAVLDMAAQTIGAVTVPIYTSLTPAEIQYLLFDSGSRLLAVSGKALFDKAASIQRSLPRVEAVIAFDAALALEKDRLTVPVVLLKDWQKTAADERAIEAICRNVAPDALASIIYTSGTTGPPKGAMLTHSNFIHNAVYSKNALKMDEREVHLSFLPLSHVFERLAGHYLMMYLGATIAYAENMETVPHNILEVRPTFLVGVPRFYEKIKERVARAVDAASSLRKGIFYWAKAVGTHQRKAREAGRKPGPLAPLERALANALVYKKFKAGLGGRVRFCVSGSAALPREIAEFFYDLGVFIIEGYGLTETSPVISANREDRFKFGTVGIPLKEVEVKITEEGEILTKSLCVMKGYYNKEEETRAVLKDGWFYTGDLGRFDKDGFLSITGRKKELIVTSGGKKVSPRAIEELLETDPFILRCVLFGEGRKFLTALIVPREEKLTEYAQERKIVFGSYKELLKNPRIYAMLDARIAELSRDLASFEKIKYFALLDHDFAQAAGELTPTLKVKRDVVLARYRDELLGFYAKGEGA
ncbi:MAG: AMP-dependent synthetase/ligase [Candidatus Omnitrophota bacterium]